MVGFGWEIGRQGGDEIMNGQRETRKKKSEHPDNGKIERKGLEWDRKGWEWVGLGWGLGDAVSLVCFYLFPSLSRARVFYIIELFLWDYSNRGGGGAI